MLLLEAFKEFKQALNQTEDSKLLRFEDAEKTCSATLISSITGC